MRHVLRTLEKVGNVELFFDLIFAYLVSVVTGLLHMTGGFFDLPSYTLYALSFITILQVWFNATFLVNRYGDSSREDSICMFVTMFCLYFMAEGISPEGGFNFFIFNVAWAALIVNLLVHWWLKLTRYVNLDEEDRTIIRRTMNMLVMQLLLILISLFVGAQMGTWLSNAALAVGVVWWGRGRRHVTKPTNFDHLAERCCLLVIVTFGEMVVDISTYMRALSLSHFIVSMLVFTLVVGLFLIYDFEYEHLLDHDRVSGGTRFMVMNSWIVFVLGNIAAGLEYLPDVRVPLVPKSLYLTAGLVAYLLTSFLLNIYNRPLFRVSGIYAGVRIGVCVGIACVGVLCHFDPFVTLVADTVFVYVALFHEHVFFRRRTRLGALSEHLGLTFEELTMLGFTFDTRQGRERIHGVMSEEGEDE